MSTITARIAFSAVSTMMAAGLVAFADPAHARTLAADDVPQRTVSVADLNLSVAAGRATFERRAAAAADEVCVDAASPTVCRRDALARALHDAGLADDQHD